MSDPFDSEKKWSNVQGARSKPKKEWQPSSGVDQKKAEALSAGVTQSPRQVLWDAIDILAGKKKKAKPAGEQLVGNCGVGFSEYQKGIREDLRRYVCCCEFEDHKSIVADINAESQ